MHEYGLMEQVIESIMQQIQEVKMKPGEKLTEVTLKVGALELHSEESFQQAFELLVKSTPLEKAALKLILIPPNFDCPGCGFKGPYVGDEADHHDPTPVAHCPQCNMISNLHGGRGIDGISLTVM